MYIPNAGLWQAVNLSREVIWVANECLSIPQHRFSNYWEPFLVALSPFFSGTGCDSGYWLDLFYMVAPFWFQTSIYAAFSFHPIASCLLARETLGKRGGDGLVLSRAETRFLSPSSCTFALCQVGNLVIFFPLMGHETELLGCLYHCIMPDINLSLQLLEISQPGNFLSQPG